ncbi:MAG: stage II sporulation protein M [Chitinophagaceae bacterium]
MRESKFVEQNREKWSKFEEELRSRKKDPDALRTGFIEITDDLSYSRTFYKNRSVRVYLNGLAQKVYHSVYRNRRGYLDNIRVFFLEEVPRILYYSRKELLVSFLVLLLSVGIGIFSSMKDPDFARSILGDEYVSETISNIESGNPMGVYKDEAQLSMFYRIAVNNLTVSLYVFLFGLFASYGALVLMVRNGVMLGVFMYFFYSRQLSAEFNLTVWMHGTIEILTLVVETVAGMLLGRGLIYPGTLSRAKAFSVWGRRGAMVFLSTVPFIVTAAFIESFLTRHTELPDVIRGLLILLSLALMVFYFVWLPYKRFKNTTDSELGIPELKPETNIDFKPGVIYNSGAIFIKSIQVLSQYFSQFIKLSVIIAFVYIALLYGTNKSYILREFRLLNLDFPDLMIKLLSFRFNLFSQLYNNLGVLFNPDQSVLYFIFSSIWIGGITITGIIYFRKSLKIESISKWQIVLISLLFSFCINSFLFFDDFLLRVLYVLMTVPLLVILSNEIFRVRKGNVLGNIAVYISNGYGRMLGMSAMFMLMNFFAMLFLITPFYFLLIYVLEMNVTLSQADYQFYVTMLVMFSMCFLITIGSIFLVIQSVFLTYTIREIADASGLRGKISEIGKVKKAYGIETE